MHNTAVYKQLEDSVQKVYGKSFVEASQSLKLKDKIELVYLLLAWNQDKSQPST